MNDLTEYLLPFLQENEHYRTLREQETTRIDVAPCVGPETGRLLTFLIKLLNAKQVIEIGTCQGYSTMWLAEGLAATGGKLTAIESNEHIVIEAKKNIVDAGFNNVDFIVDDANAVLKKLPDANYDLILQDAKKSMYIDMLEDCIRLLRPGGILVSDDILFKALGKRPSIANAMHQYNKTLVQDKRLFTTFLSVGDGVALSLKIKE